MGDSASGSCEAYVAGYTAWRLCISLPTVNERNNGKTHSHLENSHETVVLCLRVVSLLLAGCQGVFAKLI